MKPDIKQWDDKQNIQQWDNFIKLSKFLSVLIYVSIIDVKEVNKIYHEMVGYE